MNDKSVVYSGLLLSFTLGPNVAMNPTVAMHGHVVGRARREASIHSQPHYFGAKWDIHLESEYLPGTWYIHISLGDTIPLQSLWSFYRIYSAAVSNYVDQAGLDVQPVISQLLVEFLVTASYLANGLGIFFLGVSTHFRYS